MHQPRLETLKDTLAIVIQLVRSFSGLLGGFSGSHSFECIAKSIFILMVNTILRPFMFYGSLASVPKSIEKFDTGHPIFLGQHSNSGLAY